MKLDGFVTANLLLDYILGKPKRSLFFKSSEEKYAENIIAKEEGRALTIAFEALEVLGEPTTLSELNLALDLLPYAGVSGSKTVIRYTNMLFSGDYTDDSSNPRYSSNAPASAYAKASRFTYLGKAYEHVYDLENALSAHMKAFEIYVDDPYFVICNVKDVVRCLNRLGRLEESLKFLNDLKKSEPFTKRHLVNQWGDKAVNHWVPNINEALEDTMKKIDKGYVYRPRKQKEPNPLAKKYKYCDD